MYKRRIFSRRGPSARFRLPLGLVLVVLGIALCILIPSTPINLSNVNVSDKGLPTPLDTSTPAPKPTKEHIGRLIFTCTRGDYNQLCMVNADGTSYQQLTDLEAEIGQLGDLVDHHMISAEADEIIRDHQRRS